MSFGDEDFDGPPQPAPQRPDDVAETLAQLIDRACFLFKDAARHEVPAQFDADELVRLATKVQQQVQHLVLEAMVGRRIDPNELDAAAQRVMGRDQNDRADRGEVAA